MRRQGCFAIGLVLVGLLAPPVACADSSSDSGPIARFATTLGNIDVRLLTAQAPNTVANFLKYADGQDGPTFGSYSGSFIHRSVPGFVIQGGGYTFVDGEPQAIAAGPAIDSEAGVANTAGTLAMALSTGPNSATDQWFFNLADNTGLDDTSDGGPFTVFGDIVDPAAVTTLEAIENATVANLWSQWDPGDPEQDSPFTAVPVLSNADPIAADDLIYVNAISVLPSVSPTIAITTPANGQVFTEGQSVESVFSCAEASTGTGVATCAGPAAINTSQPGAGAFTVTATDYAGNTTSQTVNYIVNPASSPVPTTASTTTSTAAQAPRTTSTSPSTAPPTPRQSAPSLIGSPVTTGRGVVTMHLHCRGASRCTGAVSLTVSGHREPVGSARYSIPAGATEALHLTLSTAGRELLKHDRGRLKVTLKLAPAGANAVSARRRITLHTTR